MNQEQSPPTDELPENLAEIVAGLVAKPVPPELKVRIRSRLSRQLTPRPARRWLRHAAVAATMLTAAAAMALFLFSSSTNRPRPSRGSDSRAIARESANPIEACGPSLWTYHLAANDSPNRLDTLLSEHAVQILASDSLPVQLHSARLSEEP